MATPDPAHLANATLEECLDELNDCLATLDRFPDTVLAFAFRAQLGALLQSLRLRGDCTAEELVTFLKGLEEEALGQ